MLLLTVSGVLASQNDTMIVEVDILSSTSVDAVSIEVPDHVFLGNVTKGKKTDEFQVYVNNTGTVNITVTPTLASNDDIFSNLYFWYRQTSDWPKQKIGDFSFNIQKPTSSGVRKDHFSMWLDLTNYTGDINGNLIGDEKEITFVALPRA